MIAAVILLVAAVIWRVLLGIPHSQDYGWLHNFAPLSAIALCGAAWMPRRWAISLPLVALFLSDIALNLHYGVSLIGLEMLARYVALAGIAYLGWTLRKSGAFTLIGASVVGSGIFYLVTNSASWLSDAHYAKTFAGWVQALTVGLPEYPSTLVFYRNTLVSDILFTTLFVLCVRFANRAEETTPAHAQA